jgi:nucleotide-binding universal stress UspA family protein
VKRVLCAVDLSDASVGLLPYAHAIVRWYGGCLTVLHVVPTSDARDMRPGEFVDPVVEQLRLAVGAAGITGNRVRYEVESGEPARAIVARALAIHADTVVLGARERRGVEPLPMESVTDAAARCAPCDWRRATRRLVRAAQWSRVDDCVRRRLLNAVDRRATCDARPPRRDAQAD